MQMDKLTRDLFRSIEKIQGRGAIMAFVVADAQPGQDPNAVSALAQLALEYLHIEYRFTPVMVNGRVVDRARMARFLATRDEQPRRVNSPHLDDLRPTTQVREALGRERTPHSPQSGRRGRSSGRSSAARAESQGKVPFTLDGRTHMVTPDIYKLLTQSPSNG